MAPSTLDQALSSDSADFVKQVRTSFKGKVTRYVNALKSTLVRTGDSNTFDHNNIDHEEVLEIVSELKAAKSAVSELHTKYEVIRVHSPEGPVEEALVETDNQYIGEIESNVRSCPRIYNSYMVQHKAKDEIKVNQNKITKPLGKE